MKKFVFITTIFTLITVQSFGQVTIPDKVNTGSLYSKIGVGMPVDLSSSSADGMGALGVSFYESNVAGLANPALWGNMACYQQEDGGCFALASGGVSLQKFNGTDYTGSTSSASFSTNHFQLQLPILKNKVGVSVAIMPLTRSNYQMVSRNTRFIGTGSQRDTLMSNTRNKGTGGINSLELGVGWRINDNVSVGYAGSLILASIKNNITTAFNETGYQTVDYSMQTSGTGFGNRFGALITLPGVLRESDRLRVGTAVSLPVTIQAERVQETETLSGSSGTETVTIDEGEGLGSGEIQLPIELTGGLTYQLNPRLSFTTEALYEEWSNFSYSFDGSLNPSGQLTDRYKMAAGVRYFPFMSGSNNFFSRFKYRLGASYDTGHLQISGKRIETMLFSAGIGIPSPARNSNSSIDINFHYGIRGTESQNLVKESIWGLQLSINLAELMFFRPKLR